MIVPGRFSKLRFWRNTEISKLGLNDSYIVKKPGIIGHEFDEDFDNGFRPPGLFWMSRTKVHNV